jgi:hypothetical protein
MAVSDYFTIKADTLAEVNAVRRAVPKHQIETRLEAKTASDKDEKAAEKAWRKAVIKRDGKVCRCCKRVVVAQLELSAERLEVHHVAGRADRAVRWDVRNGCVLCQTCHSKVTQHRLFILQAARLLFSPEGSTKRYINAAKKVSFSEKKES